MIDFMRALGRPARAGALAALLLTAGSAAFAAGPSPAALKTAQEIVAATGANALFQPLVAGVVEQSKMLYLQQNPGQGAELNAIAAKLRTEYQPRLKEVKEQIAVYYTEHFDEKELQQILTFYQSPVGKKLLTEQPKVAEASMKFAQDWANKLSEEVTAKFQAELSKKGH